MNYDPIAWVERLREVNAGSLFTPSERLLIEQALSRLQKALRDPKPFVEGK